MDALFLWLIAKIGEQKLRELLNRNSSEADIRTLKQALRDSQQRRAELEGISEIVERVARQRDALFEENMQLHADNRQLRERLKALGDD